MRNLEIPFQIGMQYENWEFDLDILPGRIKGYDSYLYVGEKFTYFLNYPTDRIELLFNADVLEMVIITVKNINHSEFIEKVSNSLPKYLHNKIEYKYKYSNPYTILHYGKPDTISLLH